MTVMTSEESQAFWDAKRAARGKNRSTDAIADAARIAGIEGSNFTTSTPQEQVRSAPIVPAPVKTQTMMTLQAFHPVIHRVQLVHRPPSNLARVNSQSGCVGPYQMVFPRSPSLWMR